MTSPPGRHRYRPSRDVMRAGGAFVTLIGFASAAYAFMQAFGWLRGGLLLLAAAALVAAISACLFSGPTMKSKPTRGGAALAGLSVVLVIASVAAFVLTHTDATQRLMQEVDGKFAKDVEVAAADGSVETIEAAQYLVATGSRPWAPPIQGLEEAGYLTSTTAMELTEVPDSLLVLGGGYVALEQAQLFARLGSTVTLLVRSRLASKEESEVSKALQEVFADEGIRVVRRAVPTRVTRDAATGQVVVTADVSGGAQEFRADEVLVALGRRPVTDGLNLDAVEVKTGEVGEIVVTDQLQSSNPRIWAAGDVTGHPEFVYVAAHHGTVVAENAFTDAERSVDYMRLPRVTFTSPAIGAVGMTEAQVLAAGIRCDCRVLPLEYVPRTLVNRDTRGFIKMVANADTGEILGLTAVAKDAGELAAAGVHIIGKTIAEVADAWAPYLTMTEGIRIVAKAFTTDVSKLSCCA